MCRLLRCRRQSDIRWGSCRCTSRSGSWRTPRVPRRSHWHRRHQRRHHLLRCPPSRSARPSSFRHCPRSFRLRPSRHRPSRRRGSSRRIRPSLPSRSTRQATHRRPRVPRLRWQSTPRRCPSRSRQPRPCPPHRLPVYRSRRSNSARPPSRRCLLGPPRRRDFPRWCQRRRRRPRSTPGRPSTRSRLARGQPGRGQPGEQGVRSSPE